MSLCAFISLLYKQLLQYMLLKSFTVPSALLTELPKKFHTKLLASAFIFTKLSPKTRLLWRRRVSFEYQELLQNTPASFYLSMFKLHCKRHCRKLATYSWCTTWREYVTKTAPARRRHSVGGGGGVSKMSAAAARRRRRTALHRTTWNMSIVVYVRMITATAIIMKSMAMGEWVSMEFNAPLNTAWVISEAAMTNLHEFTIFCV